MKWRVEKLILNFQLYWHLLWLLINDVHLLYRFECTMFFTLLILESSFHSQPKLVWFYIKKLIFHATIIKITPTEILPNPTAWTTDCIFKTARHRIENADFLICLFPKYLFIAFLLFLLFSTLFSSACESVSKWFKIISFCILPSCLAHMLEVFMWHFLRVLPKVTFFLRCVLVVFTSGIKVLFDCHLSARF